jgi:hypothetical protein
MYLLAPTAGTAVAGGGIIQRLLSDEFLKKWGAPGGNMFEKGYGLRGGAINFVYKGAVFSVIGMIAGMVGTSISNGLLALRQKLDPTFVSQVRALGGWWYGAGRAVRLAGSGCRERMGGGRSRGGSLSCPNQHT